MTHRGFMGGGGWGRAFPKRSCLRLPSTILLVLLVAFGSAQADVPMPKIPKGKGDKCVEETSVMRKNHMEFLLHQRDETVHNGIRTKKHSLKECMDCHAVNDDHGLPVGIDDSRHFCNSCHGYAAVSIDCFECHASKPQMKNPVQP